MQLTDTDEQHELRASVRRFLAEKASLTEVRRQFETEDGFDRATWRRMATELGLQGVAIPEQYGGAGFSVLEQCIVLQEMGRSLYGGPYLSTAVLAAQLLLTLADEDACAEYLPQIAAGELLVSVAITEAGRPSIPYQPDTLAMPDGGAWRIDGEKTAVIHGASADLLLVIAQGPAGLGVFAVDPQDAGVLITSLPPLDLTRRLAKIAFTGAIGRQLGASADGAGALSSALDRTLAAIAAEQVGGAEACLQMSVEYAKTRVQFGRPIGAFQAVKHRCADMLMRVEFAKAAAAHAAWAVANEPHDALLATALAKAYCSDAYFRISADNIQNHGGIGFTWEHDAHLYFRRAKSLQLLLGDAPTQRARVAEALQL